MRNWFELKMGEDVFQGTDRVLSDAFLSLKRDTQERESLGKHLLGVKTVAVERPFHWLALLSLEELLEVAAKRAVTETSLGTIEDAVCHASLYLEILHPLSLEEREDHIRELHNCLACLISSLFDSDRINEIIAKQERGD